MSLAYDFGPDGFVPPGRFPVTWDQAHALYVAHGHFAASTSRSQIWDGLDSLMLEFFALEEAYRGHLNGPLIHALWLAGSFVGPKLNPGDVDATLWLRREAASRLVGHRGVGLLKRNREHFLNKYQVDLVIAYHRPVPSLFNLKRIGEDDKTYFVERGRWDDWWQRDRVNGENAPSVASSYPQRGYLEVTFDA